jgi:hypothetical protein
MGGRILVGKEEDGEMRRKAMQNEKNKKKNLTAKFIASSQNRK